MKLDVVTNMDNSMDIEIGLTKDMPFNTDIDKMIAILRAFSISSVSKIQNSSFSSIEEKNFNENDILNIIAVLLFRETLSDKEFAGIMEVLSSVYDKHENTIH